MVRKIGTTVYTVAKAWKGREQIGARLLPAKIQGYQNIEGKIYPIIRANGKEVSPELNSIYYDIEEAINAIKSKNEK